MVFLLLLSDSSGVVDLHAWSVLWYGQEVKEKTKIQSHLKGVFHRIENILLQSSLTGVTQSRIIPIDMSPLHLLVHPHPL